jgi:Rrf2 family protein
MAVPWSQTAEYALRAVVCLADHPGEALTTAAIAGHTHVPSNYLSKVLQTLARGGLVTARRGLRGGFTLSRPATAMSVLDVVNAVDPVRRIHECPLGAAGHGRQLCPLHRRMDDALAQLERAFADIAIGELVKAGKADPLCREPRLLQLERPGREARPPKKASGRQRNDRRIRRDG